MKPETLFDALLGPTHLTIDGRRPASNEWDRLDLSKAEWRETSLLLDVLAGEESPHDPHWIVPSKDGETLHRVRIAENWQRYLWEMLDEVADRFPDDLHAIGLELVDLGEELQARQEADA